MPGNLNQCHFDSYQQVFSATVVSCVLAKDDGRKNVNEKSKDDEKDNKKGKGNKQATPAPAAAENKETVGAKLYDVVLNDTILYPEGGGQPADKGSFKVGAVEAPVVYVYRDETDDSVIHRVSLEAPLEKGAKVDVSVDWQRRFDHMQQHSGQHLISALALKLFGWETKGWWLAKYPTECYVEFGVKSIEDADLQRLEDAANQSIRQCLPMKVHLYDSVEAAMKDENFRTRHTDDVSGYKGTLRVVEIDGVDFNPCCGTHMSNSSHIQVIKFFGKESNRGNTRVNFMCGSRAITNFDAKIKREQQMTALLSVGAELHVDFVKQLQNDARASSKGHKNALSELATLRGQQLAEQAVAAGEQKQTVFLHHDDDLFPLGDAADAFAAKCPNHVALLIAGDLGNRGPGQFILLGPADKVKAWGSEVAKLLVGKGGGKNRFNGKIDKLGQKDIAAARAFLDKNLSGAQ